MIFSLRMMFMKYFRLLPSLLMALAVPGWLAACAAEDSVSHLQPYGALTNAPALVAQADWSKAPAVSLVITKSDISPPELTFHRGQPVRLVIQNRSDTDRIITADGFFQTVAVRQVVGPTGTETGPWIQQVGIPIGQTKEVWFVPDRFGAWNFNCAVPGFSMLGVTGVVNVVP
jgi:uncharacterized cupredoxin-like copper-binding protein